MYRTLAAFQCIPYRTSTGELVKVLFNDPTIQCYTPSWGVWAILAGLGVAIYCIGIPLGTFYLTFKYRNDSGTRSKISLLFTSYAPAFWYWESIDLVRKVPAQYRALPVSHCISAPTGSLVLVRAECMCGQLLLTSVVLLVDPDSKVQLWFGMGISVSMAVLTIKLAPYRDLLPGLIQAAAMLQVLANVSNLRTPRCTHTRASLPFLQIVFTYMSAGLFDVGLTASRLTTSNTLGCVLVVANCTAFCVLLIALCQAIRQQEQTLSELSIRVCPAPVPAPDTLDPPELVSITRHCRVDAGRAWRQGRTATAQSVLWQPSLPQPQLEVGARPGGHSEEHAPGAASDHALLSRVSVTKTSL